MPRTRYTSGKYRKSKRVAALNQVKKTPHQFSTRTTRKTFTTHSTFDWPATTADYYVFGQFDINDINDPHKLATDWVGVSSTNLRHTTRSIAHVEAYGPTLDTGLGYDSGRVLSTTITFHMWNPNSTSGHTFKLFYWWSKVPQISGIGTVPSTIPTALSFLEDLQVNPQIYSKGFEFFSGSHEEAHPPYLTFNCSSNLKVSKYVYEQNAPSNTMVAADRMDYRSLEQDLTTSETVIANHDHPLYLQFIIVRGSGEKLDAVTASAYRCMVTMRQKVVLKKDTNAADKMVNHIAHVNEA